MAEGDEEETSANGGEVDQGRVLFRRIRLRQPRIVTLNMVLLGFVALLPFPSSLAFVIWVLGTQIVGPDQTNWAWLLPVPIGLVSRRIRNSKPVLLQS